MCQTAATFRHREKQIGLQASLGELEIPDCTPVRLVRCSRAPCKSVAQPHPESSRCRGLPDPGDLGKVILVAAFGKQVIAAKLQAGKFIGGIAKLCGGGGGGRPNLAQAGGRDGAQLISALEAAAVQLQQALENA